MKICLDAGHYGKYNRSPAVKSYYESEMNWKLHLLLEKYLTQAGFTVVKTRTDPAKDMALTTRGKAAKGCDLLLSLHSNAVSGGMDETVDYPVAYYPVSGAAKALGETLAACVASVMETKQPGRVSTRRGKHGDYYGVLRGAAAVGVPGLILEHSFHTNTRAAQWLLDEGNLDKMARAEAQVLADYFGTGDCDVKLNVLQKGKKGKQVKAMQQLLIAQGISCGACGADGSFGGDTRKAVRVCREQAGLPAGDTCDEALWSYLLGVGA